MTRTGLVAAPLHAHRRAVRRDPPRRRGRLGLEQGTLARVDTPHGTAMLRVLSTAASSRARCSCRSTGRRENSSAGPHRRAGAARHRSASPASRRPRRRRRASRPQPVAHYGFAAVAPAPAAAGALTYWAAARAPVRALLNFACDGAVQGLAADGSARPCPRASASLSTTPAPACYRAACCATAASRRCCSSGRARSCLRRVAEVAVRPRRHDRHRAPRSPGRQPARGRHRRGRHRVRVLPGRAQRASRRRCGRGNRSVESIGRQLGAGTNCGSCIPEIRRLIAGAEEVSDPLGLSRCSDIGLRNCQTRESDTVRPSAQRPRRMDRLATLPLFFPLDGRRVVVIGGSEAAAWKAELLSAAGAARRGAEPRALRGHGGAGRRPARRACAPASGGRWSACGSRRRRLGGRRRDDEEAQAIFAAAARMRACPSTSSTSRATAPSSFGAIVNRSPLVVGISTEGAAPVFGQAIRSRIEALLPAAWLAGPTPPSAGAPSLAGSTCRTAARRRFWERFAALALRVPDRVPSAKDWSALLRTARSAPARRRRRAM